MVSRELEDEFSILWSIIRILDLIRGSLDGVGTELWQYESPQHVCS